MEFPINIFQKRVQYQNLYFIKIKVNNFLIKKCMFAHLEEIGKKTTQSNIAPKSKHIDGSFVSSR